MSNAFLNIAIRAARQAAELINRASLDISRINVESKGPRDFVSEIDKRAEAIIIQNLKTAFPEHGFLAEESGLNAVEGEYQWIIDPIDGTTNFLHDVPHYAISIALRNKQHIVVGVIYDCYRNELFTAIRGEGAFMNQKRLRVSPRKQLDSAVIATGFPFKSHERTPTYLAMMAEVMSQVAGLRRMGSAALDLAWTAQGRFDGFWEMGLSPWDIAAGVLLIEEAGGRVCDFQGGKDYLNSGDVICGNEKVFQFLKKSAAQHFLSTQNLKPNQ